ncbi:DNA repair protein RadA, partial [Kocuria oceani]
MSTRTRRNSPAYRCTECGWSTAKWVGRCGECQAWGTVEEIGEHKARTTAARSIAEPARPIAQVDATVATSA